MNLNVGIVINIQEGFPQWVGYMALTYFKKRDRHALYVLVGYNE